MELASVAQSLMIREYLYVWLSLRRFWSDRLDPMPPGVAEVLQWVRAYHCPHRLLAQVL